MSIRSNPGDRRARALVVGFAVLIALVTGLVWAFCAGGADADRLARSGDRAERIEAVDRLWKSGGRKSREMLVRLSGDKDLQVAVTAVCALGHTGDAESLLEKILRDRAKPARVRSEAAAQLGRFGPQARERLCGVLQEEPDPVVRMGAAKGLWRLCDAHTAPNLVTALSDPDRRVRTHTFKALNRLMVCRFPYDPERPPDQQQQVLGEIKRYLGLGAHPTGAPTGQAPCATSVRKTAQRP